jgi:hypothetical protein
MHAADARECGRQGRVRGCRAGQHELRRPGATELAIDVSEALERLFGEAVPAEDARRARILAFDRDPFGLFITRGCGLPIEGAVEGIPSIGFSLLDWDADADFDAAAHYAQIIAQKVLSFGIPKHTCLNVNIPKGPLNSIKGVKVCRQAKAIWKENFEKRTDPMGHDYFWMTGSFHNLDHGEDTDEFALAHNYVSVVPVQHDLTAYHFMQELNDWKF